MNTKTRHPVLRFAVTVVLAAASMLCGIAIAAEPFDATSLMQALSRNRTTRANFVDRKYLASLDRPLESSGELVFVAPSRLERRTLKPKPELLIVDGDTLSIERNGTRRSLSLSSYPEAAAFTDSIRSTLAGDLAALSRDYKVVLDGTALHWRLSLLPSNPRIATLVSRVTLDGHDAVVDAVEVLQADGSRSVTTITPLTSPTSPTSLKQGGDAGAR